MNMPNETSLITFNGLDSSNILYSSDKNNGIVTHKNALNNSYWSITMNDMMWDGNSVFKTWHSQLSDKQDIQTLHENT